MKELLLIPLLFGVVSPCLAAPPPEGSFRLTIKEIAKTDHCRILAVKIEARPAAQMMELISEGRGGGSCLLNPTLKGKAREGQIILGAMCSHEDSPIVATTVLQAGPDESHVSEGASYDLSANVKLESVFALSVTNGVFKLNRPLMIGSRNGEPLQLVVGSWNWSSLASQK